MKPLTLGKLKKQINLLYENGLTDEDIVIIGESDDLESVRRAWVVDYVNENTLDELGIKHPSCKKGLIIY